jgi:CPA2 family monovalent cation:H+ antiporter-2/glutathione-regulated potassium-efflux system ancillary protein KefC/glutathione-regulated potassium-efflux system protein KefB
VGASIDFNLILANPVLIFSLIAGLILIKFIILFIIGKFFKMGLDNNLMFAFSLAQGGEFAFVLFSFALQNNVLGTDIVNPMVAVVAISMALTPLLMLVNEKLIQPRVGTLEKADRESDEIDTRNSVIIAGFGRVGSTIGRFLQANGVQATYLDIDADNVDLLRKMGLKVFYGDASRHDLLHAAGADEASLLIIAVDNPDKTLEIVETAKRHFPKLHLIVRSNGWFDSYDLIDMGIDAVYRETLDSSLKIAADALCRLGHRRYSVYRALQKFRKHDERYLRELVSMRHDRKQLISGAKQRIEDLEALLLNEKENVGKDKDLDWDATTLREEFGDASPKPEA